MLLAQSSSSGFEYSFGAANAVSLVIAVAVVGFNVFAIIDSNKYEPWVWERAGQNKTLWLVLFIVFGLLSFCCCIFGVPAPIIYFVAIKKKLDAVQSGGGFGYGGPAGPGGPGYPPPGQYPGQYPAPGQQYPPQAPGYPPQDPNYPPPAPGYPPQDPNYPPPDPGYPPQGGYPEG